MRAHSFRLRTAHRHQRGATLIVAMGMLVVIGLMSASVMRGALSSDLVANNARAQNIAQQGAEIALRYCERDIQLATPTVVTQPERVDGQSNWGQAASWADGTALTVKVPDAIMASADSSYSPTFMPECMAEDITLEDGVTKAVVITARGFSPDFARDDNGNAISGSEVWLQSTVTFVVP